MDFSFVFHLQRLPVVPLALADLARHIDVRQEVHLDLQDSVAVSMPHTARPLH